VSKAAAIATGTNTLICHPLGDPARHMRATYTSITRYVKRTTHERKLAVVGRIACRAMASSGATPSPPDRIRAALLLRLKAGRRPAGVAVVAWRTDDIDRDALHAHTTAAAVSGWARASRGSKKPCGNFRRRACGAAADGYGVNAH